MNLVVSHEVNHVSEKNDVYVNYIYACAAGYVHEIFSRLYDLIFQVDKGFLNVFLVFAE